MRTRAFTLIELLVVIAIIGILSSVVLASLNTARGRARDAAVKQGARQMATLMALQYSENGSYANLQYGWDSSPTDCNNSFTGTYATNARQICTSIVSTISGVNTFYTGNNSDLVNKFSVMAYLPGKGTWFCIGSSGAASDIESAGTWVSPGCYANP